MIGDSSYWKLSVTSGGCPVRALRSREGRSQASGAQGSVLHIPCMQDPLGNICLLPITSLFELHLKLWSPKEHGLKYGRKTQRVTLTLLIHISPGIWLELICISSQGLMRIRVMGMLAVKRRQKAPVGVC